MDRRKLLSDALVSITGGWIVSHSHGLEQFLRAKDFGGTTTGVWAGLNRADHLDWKFFEVCGQILLPMYGLSGSLMAKYGCWLVNRDKSTVVPMHFTMMEVEAVGANIEALNNLVRFKFQQAMLRGPVKCDLYVGELPMPPDES